MIDLLLQSTGGVANIGITLVSTAVVVDFLCCLTEAIK